MEPARFDEMRPGCYDIDARVADMDLDGIWASLCFPSLVAGFCGSVFSRADGQGARPGLHPGLEPLAPRGVGRHPPRTGSSPCRSRGSTTWASPPPRSGPTPHAGSGRSASPSSPPSSATPRSSPTTGIRSSPPARRPGRWSASTPGHPPGPRSPPPVRRSRCFPRVPGQRPPGRGRMAVVGGAPAVPRAPGGPVRGWDRLGADADGPGRLRPRPLGVGHRRRGWDGGPATERGPRPQLLVLHHRRPVHGAPARPDRPRPRDGRVRLPPRRLDVARHPGRAGPGVPATCPRPTCARWPPGTPRACSATRCPTRRLAPRDRAPPSAPTGPRTAPGGGPISRWRAGCGRRRKVSTASEKASLRSPAIMWAAPATSTTVEPGHATRAAGPRPPGSRRR